MPTHSAPEGALFSKRCTTCKEVKPSEAYAKDSRASDGLQSRCRACSNARVAAFRKENREYHNARQRAWHRRNPGKTTEYARKQKYGTNGAELFEKQEGKCAGCFVDLMSLPSKQRHIDHCHETGLVRGWLCHGCNAGLGNLRDDPELLERLAVYLRAPVASANPKEFENLDAK